MLGGNLGALLSKFADPLMKVATRVLPTLGLTAAMSATDGATQKKRTGSGTTTLIISNEEIADIMKIIQALEDKSILL